MAEFMTALPHINETFHRVSSINALQPSVQPPPSLCQLEVSPQPPNSLHGPVNASPSPPGKQHPGSGLNSSVAEAIIRVVGLDSSIISSSSVSEMSGPRLLGMGSSSLLPMDTRHKWDT
ncbi:uncharacterized protein CEXT_485271 [Caerostris extrusa]|uniref:Uncharacterized protein n=1 Tax=Caerostris extrusa TaxID=172846 RepID=A0AAV4XS44_CAEEX|nr:uncharacterized protein CEXT_485271 [Caerostris extrusa]